MSDSAQSPSRPRVLLIHANPYQAVLPVPAHGLERVATAIAGMAEIRLVDPWLLWQDPMPEIGRFVAAWRPDIVGFGIRVTEDLVPIARLDGAAPHDGRWLVPEIAELVALVRDAAPNALTVAGGAAFSSMPVQLLHALDIDCGIAGAGESPMRHLIARHSAGLPLTGVPGLVLPSDDPATVVPHVRPLAIRTTHDPTYAPAHGFPVRTRVGCGMVCSYCAISALNHHHADLDVEVVLDEIEERVATTRRRGIPTLPLYLADDEANLPRAEHLITILEGLLRRGLDRHILWRGYFNPTPFPTDLAKLVKATNGFPMFTVDSAMDEVLANNYKPFRRRHLDALIATLESTDLPASMVFLFGLPGESRTTIKGTVDFIRELPERIKSNWGAGLRVFPGTPLADMAAAEPHRLVGDVRDATGLAPRVYASPMPPRQLARHVHGLLGGDRAAIFGGPASDFHGVAARAYRVVLGTDVHTTWDEVLSIAATEHALQEEEALQAVMFVAAWHGRDDLALLAAQRLKGRYAKRPLWGAYTAHFARRAALRIGSQESA